MSELVFEVTQEVDGGFTAAGCSAASSTLPVPVDLLVYTPEEFARGMERGMDLFQMLAEEGVTLYERAAS